jgi:hypothetical protein
MPDLFIVAFCLPLWHCAFIEAAIKVPLPMGINLNACIFMKPRIAAELGLSV